MQIDRLIRTVRELGNPTALGLDTKLEYVPKDFAAPHLDAGGPPEAVFAFNAKLLAALRDVIGCVKIQAAYYEMLGPCGMSCLLKTINEARSLGYVVIVDAKRGDIGSTAAAYSAAYLTEKSPFRADFLTVNPYFGTDGMAPFLDDCQKSGSGLFVLVKTSNPSGKEFQDIITDDGQPLYERVAKHVSEWGSRLIGEEGYSSVGAVVGATYPKQGAGLRRKMPNTFFLLPGYGAQGALAAQLASCFDASGGGAVVAASRSIICAHMLSGTRDFAQSARAEALRMKDDLSKILRLAR
ncbi:MAG: orotidine-5'-phosphate decarboxylase [Synergistaceae bacterium]|jgi:orotidine-5'-phosphate decarboxylase|nr:orotidine-5'-phosphate decarboxylase [Synergistaceae bacterium]